ncbi:hypothetical protein BsWGS_26050 [Bradybaena similaris]
MPAVTSIARLDCASQPASSLPTQPAVTHLKSSHGHSCLTRRSTSQGATDLTTDAHHGSERISVCASGQLPSLPLKLLSCPEGNKPSPLPKLYMLCEGEQFT